MQAIILAAGMGKRLKDLTKDNTKCMVEVNGVTLIERLLNQLEQYNLSKIVVVVGYKGDILQSFISTLNIKTPIVFVDNSIYDRTNNIYSLFLAKDYLCQEDTLLFESDLIVEDSVIKSLVEDDRETLALVDKYESWMDGTCVKISENDDILEFVPGKKFKFEEIKSYYKTVNIYKFSKHFSVTHYVPFLEAYSSALGNNEYYEQVLRVITMLDEPEIKAKRLNGDLWYEIDDIQDLDIASSMFLKNEDERVAAIQSRYGGYWRYPKLIDFCYLVNPYFPPTKLIDEIKANFETLITQYPSGMRVNSLLAAKNFGVNQNNIVVGNGAAELIKSFLTTVGGNIGVIRPTFEEYPNRYDKTKQIVYVPQNDDYSYGVSDIIDYFDDKDIDCFILINPDNPSGNYLPFIDVLKLIAWADSKNIKLVIDESFADFAEEENNTLIKQDILEQYKNLFVMKSISKSYGVPGLRLGILASGNEEIIQYVKKDVSIWNINSFAEFYMQIEEKYKSAYSQALQKFKAERKRFVNELSTIKGLRLIPSQANYVMAELIGISSKELTKRLLNDYNLIIKDLSGKVKTPDNRQYIRVAIRNTEDNDLLIKALKEVIK
ncbi:MAG: aminotransferase class I/II-fold pyridoxal phosphate-dependent enzyme [Candidatus Coproplasma sp.]